MTTNDPKTTDYCKTCGNSPESAEHYGLTNNPHHYVPPDYLAGVAAALDKRTPEAGVMRVKVEDRPGMPQFGVVLGLLLDEHGDMQAVVRLDNYGLLLKAIHPSRVTPVTPEEEEAHKS